MKHVSNLLHRAPVCPGTSYSRRSFLKQAAAGTALLAAAPYALASEPIQPLNQTLPRTVTGIGLCKRYDYPLVRRALAVMLDDLGDVRQLVKNKFVTVKVNLVNAPNHDIGGIPLNLTVVAHPSVALALGSLFVEYGAKRVTFADQLPLTVADEEAFSLYGFDIPEFHRQMDGKVKFANTRNLGEYKSYDLVKVPGGGFLASAWEVNKTYTERDVLVSLGKLKSHYSGGVTMGMKNLFGVPPSSLYGDDLKGHPDESAIEYRSGTMHDCVKKPLTSIETFKNTVEHDHGFNVPHFIVDLNTAFPIDLVVVDGIHTVQTGEGWWIGSPISPCSPGLLLAGRNPVCADAVGAAVMGFDPDAPDRTHPFSNGTNYLQLARRLGLGENRIQNLEIAGVSLKEAQFNFVPTFQRVSTL